MENKKELSINNNDRHEIKLCQGKNRSIKSPSGLELSIAKCPLTCDNCKTVYSNESTGIRIRCWCSCHFAVKTKR